ncbi:MAG: RNA pseudouridine synthase [Planctomycetes bacterium]|nr:RNA pseudouridine synthase [Planctomycetota bacterium]NBY01963.1 RNA pseudouridine synthase [Planctomycetota bacterium]
MVTDPRVLFEDNHCLIIEKPAGLATQAPDPYPSLESWARSYLKTKYLKAGRPYLGIPHRLDRPVSGIVFFTRSSKAAARIAEQFRERTIAKRYLALVEGELQPDAPENQCCWLDYMVKIPDEAKAMLCSHDQAGAKLAQLEMKSIHTSNGHSLLDIHLQSGRMHQIRLQSSSRGLPIVGDFLYHAKEKLNLNPLDKRILLHSYYLKFLHPISYEPVEVRVELPSYFPQWAMDYTRNNFFPLLFGKA